jgi:hypothetical protein
MTKFIFNERPRAFREFERFAMTKGISIGELDDKYAKLVFNELLIDYVFNSGHIKISDLTLGQALDLREQELMNLTLEEGLALRSKGKK